MPLTLNIGITKKHGLPDYGSIGATCQVTVELDSSVMDRDLDSFHGRVRSVYDACAQAVNDELARHCQGYGQPSHERVSASAQNGCRSLAQQLGYLRQLAGQIPDLGDGQLDELAKRLFQKSIDELSSFDASSLIDTLKAVKAGQLSLATALRGATHI